MLNHEGFQKIFNGPDAIIRSSWLPSMSTSTAATPVLRLSQMEYMSYTFDEHNVLNDHTQETSTSLAKRTGMC